jgi:hypothetical protein
MSEVNCPVCNGAVSLEAGMTKKKNKPCLMFVCARSGSHFRGFINDQEFISRFTKRVQEQAGERRGR